jgi:hypothetical protein
VRHFLREWRARRKESSPDLVMLPPLRPKPPAFRGAYSPLYAYLEHRYATTVVLTFLDIEALLGFPLPDAARSSNGWWTAPVVGGDRHTEAWSAAHRTATPNLAARHVAFDKVA